MRTRLPPRLYFAFQNITYAQIFLHLLQRLAAGVIVLRRGPRNHRQFRCLQPRDLRDHLFGKAVAEVVIFPGPAEIAKRQHRQLDLLCLAFVWRPGRNRTLQTVAAY